jgi:hypothetical protein
MLGAKPFVEEMFARMRHHFPPGRRDAARSMRGFAPPPGEQTVKLCTARALRTDVIS